MSLPEEFDVDLSRRKLAAYAVGALIVAIIELPAVQSFGYRLLFGTPSVVQWGLVSVVVAAVAWYRDSDVLLLVAVGVFVVLGLVVGPVASGVYAHSQVADRMQRDATQLDTLPNTSQRNVRVLPRSVSDNYAQSSMQYPQYRLTESDITYRNGTYTWSHGLVPDNFLVSLFGHQRGAMYVDMTTTRKSVSLEDTEYRYGRGQRFFDAYAYRSVLHAPLKLHDWETTFNAQADGTSYIAHSTTAYRWRFRAFPLPQLYAVPHHASVEVMRPNGHIRSLSPQEAATSPLLRGQNVYPYHLARFKVESMQYVHGVLNKWFWKEDVLAVADLPEAGNQWPLVVPTAGREPELTYFVATEPAGSGNGVYEVWTFDGQTGAAGVQRYSEAQIGPQKAVDFVARRPQVNRLSNADAVAPVPIVRDGTLYWHVKVVSKSRSGVVYTAFVNAESGDVTVLDGTKPIYAFLNESAVEKLRNRTERRSGDTTVRVVVTNADGEIVGTQNVTVPDGGDVQISINDTSNATARAGG
ncbi:MAG: hypothetical protein ABEI96_00755 [Haloarculaceae archaeon]